MQNDGMRPATTYPAIVGGVLAQIRNQQGLHQDELAQALGITQSTLSRIEKGQSSMSVEHLRLAAQRLGTTPSAILDHADQAERRMHNQGIAVTAMKNDEAFNNTMVLIGAVALTAIITTALVSAQKG
jgi:transcriptional regulator with XRE-family HTH domain